MTRKHNEPMSSGDLKKKIINFLLRISTGRKVYCIKNEYRINFTCSRIYMVSPIKTAFADKRKNTFPLFMSVVASKTLRNCERDFKIDLDSILELYRN